ncbi:MAG: hypothetical protein Q7U14_04250, partial [Lacisediminimonas sp.]|nr:hypothetical protein [Lacisediminimonas sp.]
ADVAVSVVIKIGEFRRNRVACRFEGCLGLLAGEPSDIVECPRLCLTGNKGQGAGDYQGNKAGRKSVSARAKTRAANSLHANTSANPMPALKNLFKSTAWCRSESNGQENSRKSGENRYFCRQRATTFGL